MTTNFKITIATFATIFAAAFPAKADVLCGPIEKKIIKPSCAPDQMCAQYFREAPIMIALTGAIELQTLDHDVLDQIVANEDGQPVCVLGEQPPEAQYFEVTAINPAP